MGTGLQQDLHPDIDEDLARRAGITRRDFLRLWALGVMGLGLSGLGLGACTQEQIEELLEQIQNRPVRRDVSSLANNDPVLNTYRDAITAMQALPEPDRRNWTRQAQIHLDHCPHGNWLFLPWHRAYLWRFEEICRELTGDEEFALPYWNWTTAPHQIPSAFFDSGDPLFNGSRSAGPASSANAAIVGQANIDTILAETNFENFASGPISATADQRTSSFYGPLEGGPHNYVHGFVGGDMATFMSPLDPLFWLHHNRIEQLWVEWNLDMGNPNTSENAWTQREFADQFCDRDGALVSDTVAVGLLYPLLSYRFDTQEV